LSLAGTLGPGFISRNEDVSSVARASKRKAESSAGFSGTAKAMEKDER
jgi:hypothetical protein